MSFSQKTALWKPRALAMFCSNSQVIYCFGGNCFCSLPNGITCEKLYMRSLQVYMDLYGMYLCLISYFLSYHIPLLLLIISTNRIFLNFLENEFRIFLKEYTSSEKMQKANLLLSLLFNTICLL